MTRIPPGTNKAANGSDMRQRSAAKEVDSLEIPTPPSTPRLTAKSIKVSDDTGGIGLVDILRIIAGLALLSTAGSYLITSGFSYTWNLRRPWWTKPAAVSQYMRGPLNLTPAQLASYTGADASQPILIALNRTIYDVSASPAMYGPAGPYSALAAKDATRAFITGCFGGAEFLVPQLEGVEEIFVPLWLSVMPSQSEFDGIAAGEGIMDGNGVKGLVEMVQKKIGAEEMGRRRGEAYDAARETVRTKIKGWESVFERKGYPVVGEVVGVDEDDSSWKDAGFCPEALKSRPPMLDSLAAAMKPLADAAGLDMGKIAESYKAKVPGGQPPPAGGQHPAGVHPHAHGGAPLVDTAAPNPHAGGAAKPRASGGENPHSGKANPHAKAPLKKEQSKTKKPTKENKVRSKSKVNGKAKPSKSYDRDEMRRLAEAQMAGVAGREGGAGHEL